LTVGSKETPQWHKHQVWRFEKVLVFFLSTAVNCHLLTFSWYNFFMPARMAKPVFTAKSSTIHKVEYDEKEKKMTIEFRSGNIYRYSEVPPRLWKVFQLYIEVEGSAGSFFNEYIKNQFPSEKIHDTGAPDE
jgi:lysyl-tRNA synthetase class 2